jgi:hypothetical protein
VQRSWKEKGLAWVPKWRIQAQKDDAQASVQQRQRREEG